MKQRVVAIAKARLTAPKIVEANQKAIDELPLNSGSWRVRGVPGLYVRARRVSKSFMLVRRVRGKLVQRIIGQMTLKQARLEAMKQWTALKPTPAGGEKTFGEAFDEFMAQRELSAKTREIYSYNFVRHLADWKARALLAVGDDRAGVRALYHALVKKNGTATASQVIRMFSAVFRYAKRVDKDLPESPTVAVDLPAIKSRDWAYSPAQLVEWWTHVSELNAIKQMWWTVALFTGARRKSVESLKWDDIDTEKRTIMFRVTKGNRPYMVPAADRLIELLAAYRASDELIPSQWCFPSSVKDDDSHLVNCRDDKRHVHGAHHLRHTFRTTLTELRATTDQARLLMGHSLAGDVSLGYITSSLLIESLRPLANQVAEHYAKILSLA